MKYSPSAPRYEDLHDPPPYSPNQNNELNELLILQIKDDPKLFINDKRLIVSEFAKMIYKEKNNKLDNTQVITELKYKIKKLEQNIQKKTSRKNSKTRSKTPKNNYQNTQIPSFNTDFMNSSDIFGSVNKLINKSITWEIIQNNFDFDWKIL